MIERREATANDLPSFEDQMGHGTISAAHIDALGAARRHLDTETRTVFDDHEAVLLEHAQRDTVDAFSRRCRELARHLVAARPANDAEELDRQRANSTVKRWVDKVTGMHLTKLELDPIRDSMLWSAVNAHLGTMRQNDGNAKTPWMQLQVDAFVAAVSGPIRSEPAGGARDDRAGDAERCRPITEIAIVVDLATMLDGLHAAGICETEDGIPIPVSTVRRMCCDAEVLPVVLDGEGMPLDVGRTRRTVTRSQRRALRTMYRSCGHPECTVPFSACKIHHIRWWWQHNGPTDIDNLIPLCERHHHLVHEGRWGLAMATDRSTTWSRPDGVIELRGASPTRRPAAVASSNAPPGIDST